MLPGKKLVINHPQIPVDNDDCACGRDHNMAVIGHVDTEDFIDTTRHLRR